MLAFASALVVLLTHSAVRRGILAPFGWWPRAVRRASDPVLRPVERRLLSAGANPQDAPLWLLGIVAVAGLLTMSLAGWAAGSIELIAAMRGARPVEWLRLGVGAGSSLLMGAIIVRVIASWLGLGRYSRWMRPFYLLTDWIIEPLRRRLPPMGLLDLSPFVAYLLLLLLRSVLLGVLQ